MCVQIRDANGQAAESAIVVAIEPLNPAVVLTVAAALWRGDAAWRPRV